MEWVKALKSMPVTDMGDKNFGTIDVIVYDGSSVFHAIYQEGRTIEKWGSFGVEGITHWAYLPEPPKE